MYEDKVSFLNPGPAQRLHFIRRHDSLLHVVLIQKGHNLVDVTLLESLRVTHIADAHHGESLAVCGWGTGISISLLEDC